MHQGSIRGPEGRDLQVEHLYNSLRVMIKSVQCTLRVPVILYNVNCINTVCVCRT